MLGLCALSTAPLSDVGGNSGFLSVEPVEISLEIDESIQLTYNLPEEGDGHDTLIDVEAPDVSLWPLSIVPSVIEIDMDVENLDESVSSGDAELGPDVATVTVSVDPGVIDPSSPAVIVPSPVIISLSYDKPTVDSTVTARNGRDPIAVDQTQGGDNYPFSEQPSDDISDLVADLYFGFEAEVCDITYPLKLAWLSGFGEVNNPPIEGWPEPTHEYDLVITDGDDNVVFDSTEADWFEYREWGDRLRVAEWRTDTKVCRIVWHVAWDPDRLPEYRTYDRYIQPENALIDARACEEWARRLNTVIVETESGDVTANATSLKFQAGYNMQMLVEAVETLQGAVSATEVELSALAGAGLGQYPGCSDTENTIRSISGVAPDKNGNFIIDTGDADGKPSCYRISVPSVITNEESHVVEIEEATLELANDCDPCCQCSQYEAVYNAIVRLHNRYVALAQRAACVRDKYEENRERWIEAGRDRLAKPLRLVVMPGNGCVVEVAGAYCNNTGECIDDLELRFEVSAPYEGIVTCDRTFRSGNITGSDRAAGCLSPTTLERTQAVVDWGTVSIFFDRIPKGGMAYGRFQIQFPEGCIDGDQITVSLQGFVPVDNPVTYDIGWPDEEELTDVSPILVTSTIHVVDPCSVDASE